MGIGVTKVQEIKNGSIIIGCRDEIEREKLRAAAKEELKEKYKVEVPRVGLPKIKIVGVDTDEAEMNDNEILKALCNQNNLETGGEGHEQKVIYKYINKMNGKMNIILQVNNKNFEEIILTGRLNLGYRRYKVEEYVSIVQCFNCWGYGHMASRCKKNGNCRKCGEEHKEKECKETEPICINCTNRMNKYNITDTNIKHVANDRKCPCYLKIINKEKGKIRYEDI
ncbi:hypothetical protein KPH14_001021 [Odynerus spinipes]|uniref:CCHC-type domain-containing protein n=1 Tax=Odynerus spinipes TaxID=1348599 RepID=A0AAD9VKM3_9HYME|nr:hypothetical protein KPH14_001021 [Odynerus spinipes]